MKEKVLTPLEVKLLDAVKTHNTVAFAAQSIGLKPKTGYNMLFRLRKKYLKARKFVNTIEAQKRRSDRLQMILTDRMEDKELRPQKRDLESKEEDN